MACNQDGDSDTCGAVSGSIAGALYGVKYVPKNWLTHMECLDLLQTLAKGLYEQGLGSAAAKPEERDE